MAKGHKKKNADKADKATEKKEDRQKKTDLRKEKKGKQKDWPSWHDDLGTELAQRGLRVKTVAADGNCFFRACADQLEGSEHGHVDLRHETVQFMKEHQADFEFFIEDDEKFDHYCKRMQEDSTWAGQQEQVALARLKGVKLRIYQAGQPSWVTCPDYDECKKAHQELHISYHSGEHYNSVRLLSDYSSGPPQPIILGEGGGAVGASVATPDWDAKLEKELERCTGCTSTAMIQVALRDAGGKLNEAMELLFERMALDLELPNFVSDEGKDCMPALSCPTSKEISLEESAPAGPSATSAIKVAEGHCRAEASLSQVDGPDPEQVQTQSAKTESDNAVAGCDVAGEEVVGKGKSRQTGRKQPCPCGSGRKYKDCCRKAPFVGGVLTGNPNESVVGAGSMSAIYV